MGGIKKIDIAKIKKQLKSIEIAKVLREYFVPGTNFLISDLP